MKKNWTKSFLIDDAAETLPLMRGFGAKEYGPMPYSFDRMESGRSVD